MRDSSRCREPLKDHPLRASRWISCWSWRKRESLIWCSFSGMRLKRELGCRMLVQGVGCKKALIAYPLKRVNLLVCIKQVPRLATSLHPKPKALKPSWKGQQAVAHQHLNTGNL